MSRTTLIADTQYALASLGSCQENPVPVTRVLCPASGSYSVPGRDPARPCLAPS